MPSPRMNELTDWVAQHTSLAPDKVRLDPVGGDASARGYYRLHLPDGSTRILMDAPPDTEDSRPFITIARQWQAAMLPVPRIHEASLELGALLLDDLGDTPLQTLLTGDGQVQYHAAKAFDLIAQLQNRTDPSCLPVFDHDLIQGELDLFTDWCLSGWLDLEVPPDWTALCQDLTRRALQQPRATVHRDFDAMNLMVKDQQLVMIDFQDAVQGPLAYDPVSLLRGRYWRFTPEQVTAWLSRFHEQARQDGRLTQKTSRADFLAQAQALGAQRSLKVLGIFCRLTLRDHKVGYLARLPRFLDHLEDSLEALGGHSGFHNWLRQSFRPALVTALARAHQEVPK